MNNRLQFDYETCWWYFLNFRDECFACFDTISYTYYGRKFEVIIGVFYGTVWEFGKTLTQNFATLGEYLLLQLKDIIIDICNIDFELYNCDKMK